MYLITNRSLCEPSRYVALLKEASFNGVNYIVLREKDLSSESLEKLYIEIKKTINKDTKVIINNNYDVYKSVDADGLHLSYNNFIKINKNNKLDNKNNKLLGVSLHNIEEVENIIDKNIDYIFLSHIYETKCKEGLKPKGLKILKNAKTILKGTNIKLVALGGIIPDNYDQTIKHCDDVAVMSTIMKSINVKNTIDKYIIR
ncbi:MAG: thiamine phosphate synthase [Paraclostridium sp.]